MPSIQDEPSRIDNPCLKEQNLSFKCLDDNNYERAACYVYFENYNTCKRFWASIMKHRKDNGIYPRLPPAEERDKIKSDILNK
ncbi:coiled-coil-helix-coiled-coil-helix domain-containing protein 7 [Arctopsyche grandis]|uniref:coiled-coil-helix-coiled-coil-helix domain-containing protein 7 n=1 Tax=Arctopsyche grandis TaxID=121162 RepID=UPI00406D6C17